MSFEAQKITGYASGIAALPDKVEGRAAWLKAQFDARTDGEVKTQHNALCDALGEPDAAAGIGAQAPEGIAASPAPASGTDASVQSVLQGLADHTNAHTARRDNPHGVTAAQLDAYTRAQTDGAIAARIVQIGAGDMAKSVYDPQGLGLPFLPENGDGTQVTAVFVPALQDEDICSGETLGVLFGKLARRLMALADALSDTASAAHTHTKADVGLENVDNTADSEKSVSYADTAGAAVDQTARNTANAAMPKTGGAFSGNIQAVSTYSGSWQVRNSFIRTSAGAAVTQACYGIYFDRK